VVDLGSADQELAARCLAGEPTALVELEAGPLAEAAVHLASLGFGSTAVDESLQRARTKLVVDKALAAYRGRGSLALFVRTTAVRLAVDAHRKTRREVELGELLAAPLDDPELEYMRKLYADNLVAAAREAWTRLEGHERFLLALRIYDQMSVDDLARVYQIHRASAARRAAAARAAFVGHVRAALRAKLAVGDSTLDSILRIVTTSVQLPFDEAFTSE
jgi:RNA polymerase sigma-70 factor (ECF subfamily)